MEKPGNNDQEENVLDDANSLKSNSQYSTSYVNQNQVNYGFSQKTFIPKGGSFGGSTSYQPVNYAYYDPDDDNDGILDYDDPDHPSNIYTDGDGIPDILDAEDDGDGILDYDDPDHPSNIDIDDD